MVFDALPGGGFERFDFNRNPVERRSRDEGFDAVTLRGVAAAAGYTNGALKPYFDSKDDLLIAAYTRAYDRSTERAEHAIRGRRRQ